MQIVPTPLKEIAALVNAKFIGDPQHLVLGFNEIHRVQKGDCLFVDHPKYYDKALNSAASTIIINKEVVCPEGKALIICDEPFSAFNTLTKHFSPRSHAGKNISDSAVIGQQTVIMP